MQLRDALGDSVEWIRDWSEDGSQSPGSLRKSGRFSNSCIAPGVTSITRISQEINKYKAHQGTHVFGCSCRWTEYMVQYSLSPLALLPRGKVKAKRLLSSQHFLCLVCLVFIFQICSVLSLGACVVRFRDRRQAEAWSATRQSL